MRSILLFAPLMLLQSQTCNPPPPAPQPPPAPSPTPPPAPAPAPSPPPAPPPAPSTDVYDDACANEKKLGCPVKSDCAAVFRHAVSAHITKVSEATAQCIVKAGDKTSVRACGYADCP